MATFPGKFRNCISSPKILHSSVYAHCENEQLEEEIRDGVWYLAEVSKEVLFRSRDRLGAKRAKPLWTEIIELMDYGDIRDQLYGEDGEENR